MRLHISTDQLFYKILCGAVTIHGIFVHAQISQFMQFVESIQRKSHNVVVAKFSVSNGIKIENYERKKKIGIAVYLLSKQTSVRQQFQTFQHLLTIFPNFSNSKMYSHRIASNRLVAAL